MLQFLSDLDTQIFLAINGFHTAAIDQFMWLISNKLIWVPLYAVTLALLIHRYGWRAGLMVTAGAIVAVTIADQTCASLIRPVVERMRPSNTDNPLSALVHIVNDYHGGRYGFPSCHAANTFAFATFMSRLFRMRGIVFVTLFGWALINCWSRMYLGVHYPGDLIVGAIIGSASGYATYRMFIILVNRMVRTRMRRDMVKFRFNFSSLPEIRIESTLILATVGLGTSVIALVVSVVTYALS
ncbi:MAG: phosphatase PAP2 family protein [Bacteroides sp.]|nr:phosphatase PAP2 family protein [Bacteroides sp.]MBD5308625.1 phosphatase PAP2 family protein [Bacteroides sp.]